MTATAEAPPSTASDEAIRDWGRATNWTGSDGRGVGGRGRIPAELRAAFNAIEAEAAGGVTADPPPPPPAVPDRGPQIDSAGPGPAAAETPPRRVRSPGTGIRARARRALGAGAGKGKSKRGGRAKRAAGDRVSTERLVGRVWDGLARTMQPVNLPVARCLSWQSTTAGAILDDAVKGTIIDRALQPIARAEASLEKIGALVGPPVLVLALQLPQNQPVRMVETIDEESGEVSVRAVPWPVGAMRHQFILTSLVEALEMCVEAQAALPEEVRERQAEREASRQRMEQIVEMFFAPAPADSAAAAAEAERMAAAREHARGV